MLQSYAALLTVVTLLTSLAPLIKYLLNSNMEPLIVTCGRAIGGCAVLLPFALLHSRRAVRSVSVHDVLALSAVGLLGVGSYAVAAWGLFYTSIIHYMVIYSLMPACVVLIESALHRALPSPMALLGTGAAFAGGVLALPSHIHVDEFGKGELLILTFTIMMAGHIVLSRGVVRQHGVLTANVVMFSVSGILLGLVTWAVAPPIPHAISLSESMALLYLGGATVLIFVLRHVALARLATATVAGFHNLVPVASIALAHFVFDEDISVTTLAGTLIIMLGLECIRQSNEPRTIARAREGAGFPKVLLDVPE